MRRLSYLFGKTLTRTATTFTPVATRLKKGRVSPMLMIDPARDDIRLPEHAFTGVPPESPENIKIYNSDEIVKIRRAAKLARKMLEFANSLCKPGVTVDQIDKMTHNEIIKNGAYPTPLNYAGFPKSICASVNEVVCHGIPDSTVLKDGDIISIDVSLYTRDGYHGDNCGTVVVGQSNESLDKLIHTTKHAVNMAMSVCKPGACFSQIGGIINEIADAAGYSVIHEFCGHGTGKNIHMKPLVIPYRNNVSIKMAAGMVFTIEPILVEGSRMIESWDDGWTASTKDGGRGAQIEHEVLITPDGYEILTSLEDIERYVTVK